LRLALLLRYLSTVVGLAHPSAARPAICSPSVSDLFIHLNDSCETTCNHYLKSCRTDLCQIISVGRTIAAVGNQSKSSFSISGNQFLLFLSTQLMGVAVGRRLVAQPGGLMSGFALHLVSDVVNSFITGAGFNS